MKCLNEILKNNPAVQALMKQKGSLGNLTLTQEALLYSILYEEKKEPLLIVKGNNYTAQKLAEQLQALVDEKVLVLSMEDSLRVEAIASSPESKARQLEVMNEMLNNQAKIIITHAGAMLKYLPSPELFKKVSKRIKVDDELSMNELKEHLYIAGYEHVSRVDQPLCYAYRGGIVDVFSINHDYPIRIEFFDTVVDSIRYFDPLTQKTIRKLDEVEIIPATDLLFDDAMLDEIDHQVAKVLEKAKVQLVDEIKEELIATINEDIESLYAHRKENHLYRYMTYLKKNASIFDYFDGEIILSSIEDVKETTRRIQEETIQYIQELFAMGKGLPTFTHFHAFDELLSRPHQEIQRFVDYKSNIVTGFLDLPHPEMPFEKIMQEIIAQSKLKIILICAEGSELRQIKQYFEDQEIGYHLIKEDRSIGQGIACCEKKLVNGFECTNEKLVVYTSKEIFHVKKKIAKYTNKFKQSEVLSAYQQLEKGDYVVHQQHGVGMYNGIITKEVDGIHKDFLQVIYKGDDMLLVPLEQFKLIRKFVSKEGAAPKLNKLGSNEWEKTKKKVSKNVEEIAQRLVALYSLREENIGHAFAADSVFQQQFEDDFEYELTPDQAKAVAEIKQDMESSKPMDRLLCGDVGFGKTEVAIRAAFKAVCDNKQVAFLCPTTILSAQHYKVFMKRFRNYPVRIEVMNRFTTVKQQHQIIKDLKDGKVDILIGTHRILSKDIIFYDLGFLIIDEEQRFGVQHKEKIKELKASIDVLSLSATPIPRTLQMSLIGVRSLSQLDTPPLNRHPVQTYVIEKNFNMIKEIIQREIAREGQVFYLYNNVKNIYAVATKLRNELDIDVGVAHGQMDRDEIEDVMIRFTNNEYQVLVCTTIIETGIDIPNANTIIIEDADRFGLSQLYQIKGRVGRSDRLAYAYLLYRPDKQLSEVAMKRLKSIKEFAQLGSGYKIAMRDLTIRGAGDLLGPQQAGFIDTIGIDMYMEMLHDAIAKEKGIVKEAPKEMKRSNLKLDAYIPEQFANEDFEKISLYQQIDKISSKEELLDMMDMVKDNYGQLPNSVNLLFEKKRLDILLNENTIDTFKENQKDVELCFNDAFSQQIDGVKLFEIVTGISRDIRLRYEGGKIALRIPKSKQWYKMVIELLERGKNALKA